MVTPTEAGTGGLGLTIVYLTSYFYANDGLVASTQPERIHRAFDLLAGLAVLQKNMTKTVGMAFHPYHVSGGMPEAAYAQRVTGKGPMFWQCQRMQVECPECRV